MSCSIVEVTIFAFLIVWEWSLILHWTYIECTNKLIADDLMLNAEDYDASGNTLRNSLADIAMRYSKFSAKNGIYLVLKSFTIIHFFSFRNSLFGNLIPSSEAKQLSIQTVDIRIRQLYRKQSMNKQYGKWRKKSKNILQNVILGRKLLRVDEILIEEMERI